ncbi:GlsB/YeaQ/YmgE family stress response membrane protein [Streptomyces hiroshimensis]|uniref:Signal peptidase n=1 Tax=Streptomyces hiroshimensis TaxID=66424 RepID=A0ABQ2YUU9_9ACTN|nr:GlsB/YeaQ/YmgE family stress response membrane protein [Streptomyces hiroshimensis]GGX94341.1 signal peptidase [Streptomyces hiroshimensis]
MSWLWAIIVGLVLGLIAKAILPGKQQIPLWLTIILGMIGSLLGNWAATGLGINETKGIDWGRHLLQLAGAVLVVAVGDRLWVAVRGGNRSGGRHAA